jgi:hypothetical protein
MNKVCIMFGLAGLMSAGCATAPDASAVVTSGLASEASLVRVTEVSATQDGHIQFDISWDDSWRASWKEAGTEWTNWDAAWVFVKYRKKGDKGWGHATLSTEESDHAAPAGAKLDVGVTGKKGTGVFLYRAENGKGPWANKGVTLKWLSADDGVKDASKVELRVNALEMVYVPQGRFVLGDPGKVAGSFCDGETDLKALKTGGSSATGNVIPFTIDSEAELMLTDKPGHLWGTFHMGDAGKLPAEYPKGYAAFYCMKYETSQGEYADFLDQLSEDQAAARYPRLTIRPKVFKRSKFHSITNVAGDYMAVEPKDSCNWISWADSAAYADWSGLRPMSELEYEKACRGPLHPVAGEYAWGNSDASNTVAMSHTEIPLAPYPEAICGKKARTKAGSTYWGIATMSGHLRDRVVNLGLAKGREFTGLCGDGELDADGLADVPGWPGPSSEGIGTRGGPWYDDLVRRRVSDRYLSVAVRHKRGDAYGFRGVR